MHLIFMNHLIDRFLFMNQSFDANYIHMYLLQVIESEP